MGLEDRRQDALDQLEELTDDGDEIMVDADPESPDEENEDELDDEEEEETQEEADYVSSLREEHSEDELREIIDAGRNAREMRRSANEKFENANRLAREAQQAQFERDRMIQTLQSGGPEAVRQQFPEHFSNAQSSGWDDEEDPVAKLQSNVQALMQRQQQYETGELRREADRQVERVLGRKEFNFLGKRSKLREVITSDLVGAVFNPENGVTDANIEAKVTQWARDISNDWKKELRGGHDEYVERKRATKKKHPPSGKGPKGQPRTQPKRKKKVSFASRSAWKDAGSRALDLLNNPDLE